MTYAYDAANRMTSRTNAVGTWAYGYDANGNQTLLDPPGSGSVTTSFDVANRPSAVDYSDSTADVSFAYDANSNRSSMTDGQGLVAYAYDDRDRVTSITRGTETFSYAYDANSNVTSRTYPDSTVVSATYDDASRLASVTKGSATTTYAYDVSGNLVTTAYPTGNGVTETRTYDRAGRLTKVSHAKGGSVIAEEALSLDAVGNPLTATDAASVTTAYEYDSRHRLTKACFAASSCTGASDWVSYSYDAVSNRTAEGRPAGTTTYTYNAADQLSSQSGLNGAKSFSYDARGNQVGAGSDTFAYNLADRMTSAAVSGTTTTYSYDGDGVRLDATSGSATTRFLWEVNNPLPLLALETDGSGGVLRRYAYGHDLLSMEDASGSYYFHADHLGSVIEVTNATGATQWEYGYEPYGVAKTTTQVDPNAPANAMRFTGQYLDGTGLYHLRARQYDPMTGVFGGLDPISPGLGQPYTSAYGYVMGHPTVGVDPSGLICFSCPVKKVVKAADDAWDATGGRAASWVANNPGTAAVFSASAVCTVASFGTCVGAIAVGTAAKIAQNGSRYGLGSDEFWKASGGDLALTWFSVAAVGAPLALAGRSALGRWSLAGLNAANGALSAAPALQEQLVRGRRASHWSLLGRASK